MLRLEQTARHVCGREPLSGRVPPAAPPVLLTDAQVRAFCAHNFIVLRPSTLCPDFHQDVFNQLEALHSSGDGIPANSALMEAVPALQSVYDDPTIRGGIESLVGPGAMMHYHRHCHRREAAPDTSGGGQNWYVLKAILLEHVQS